MQSKFVAALKNVFDIHGVDGVFEKFFESINPSTPTGKILCMKYEKDQMQKYFDMKNYVETLSQFKGSKALPLRTFYNSILEIDNTGEEERINSSHSEVEIRRILALHEIDRLKFCTAYKKGLNKIPTNCPSMKQFFITYSELVYLFNGYETECGISFRDI